MSTEVRRRKNNSELKRTFQSKGDDSSQLPRLATRCQWLKYALCAISSFLLVGLLVLICIPSPIRPIKYRLDMTNPKHLNDMQIELLLEKEIIGPESIVIHGVHLYTGTYNLGVVRIHQTSMQLTKLPSMGSSDNCGHYATEETCGRPLGMRIHDGYLYVMDAYLGLHKYDLKDITKPPIKLYANVTFGNDLAIASNGLIYFSDSSRKWQRRDFMMSLLEASEDGFLIEFNETSSVARILSNTLSFANGVELSPDEDFVLVAETSRARVARYWLKGPKAGFWDYFIVNLPALCDNIRLSRRGTFWLATTRLDVLPLVAPYPFVRSLLAKILMMLPQKIISIFPKVGLLLEVDLNGNIVQILRDPSGVVNSISEVEVSQDGVAYLGSFGLPFLARGVFN